VINAGPSLGASVMVEDTLPTGVTFGSFSQGGTQCSAAAGVVTCALGDLAPSATRRIVFSVQVNPGTTANLANEADVSSGAGPLDGDPDTGNNLSIVNTTVVTQANLAITVTDAPDPIKRGGTLVYTLSVSNQGPSNALSVEINDTLPANVGMPTFPPGSPCSVASQNPTTVECNLGTLNAGASRQVTFSVVVGAQATGSLVNHAAVSSLTTDPVPANNSANATTTVDTQNPQVTWVSPGPGGEYYEVGQIVRLVVTATDDIGIDHVTFARWDKDGLRWVVLFTDTAAPYSYTLDSNQLPVDWNEIGVIAYDRAGNVSGSFGTDWIFVLILRWINLPIVLP
jgi:uncharacterized repeat protein (TIGR01451 family)